MPVPFSDDYLSLLPGETRTASTTCPASSAHAPRVSALGRDEVSSRKYGGDRPVSTLSNNIAAGLSAATLLGLSAPIALGQTPAPAQAPAPAKPAATDSGREAEERLHTD